LRREAKLNPPEINARPHADGLKEESYVRKGCVATASGGQGSDDQGTIVTELAARAELTKRRMRGEGCTYTAPVQDAFLPGYVKKVKRDYASFDVARLKCDLDDECRGITQALVDEVKVLKRPSVRSSVRGGGTEKGA
jgi:hypothetical protein